MSTIKVQGMSCGHCTAAVTKALENIEGVTNVTVDLQTATAEWQEEQPVDREQVKQAILAIGFEPQE